MLAVFAQFYSEKALLSPERKRVPHPLFRHPSNDLALSVYRATCRVTCPRACTFAVWKLITVNYATAASLCCGGVYGHDHARASMAGSIFVIIIDTDRQPIH